MDNLLLGFLATLDGSGAHFWGYQIRSGPTSWQELQTTASAEQELEDFDAHPARRSPRGGGLLRTFRWAMSIWLWMVGLPFLSILFFMSFSLLVNQQSSTAAKAAEKKSNRAAEQQRRKATSSKATEQQHSKAAGSKAAQ